VPGQAPVVVGLVGAGFAGRLHAQAWRRVASTPVELRAVASARAERALALATDFRIPGVCGGLHELLADPLITVVDLAVPNHLHEPMAVAALRAGKHVIVEKPLTGCFVERAGSTAATMLEAALRSADAMIEAASDADRWLCYAENWLYAPPFVKAERLVGAAGGTILRMQGEESHSGTHAEANHHWRTSGGGSLLGKGCHPLAAMLHLKGRDGHRARSVVAETATLTKVAGFTGETRHYVRTGYEDVEDWGCLAVTFTDGTVGEVTAADVVLGGVRNQLRVFVSNAVVEANLNPNTAVHAYAPDPTIFAGEYLSEKLETHAGWSYPSPDEEWMQGYPQEIEDFAAAVAGGHPPKADGRLGRDVLEVVYAAYVSAEEGRRVTLT